MPVENEALSEHSENAEPNPPSAFAEAAREAVREWVSRLRSDRAFCRAMENLMKHASEPALRKLLMEMLPLLAAVSLPRKGRNAIRSLEGVWASDTGKSWKALNDFPTRLRRIADEIQRINESRLLSPSVWIRKDTVKGQVGRRQFGILPNVLRVYALWLESLVSDRIPSWFRAELPPVPRGHSPALFLMCSVVKLATGRFHDKEVCDLLDSAASALGVRHMFDPTLLAQARGRYAKKREAT